MTEQAKAAKLSEDEVAEVNDGSEIEGPREFSDAELEVDRRGLIFVADEPISARAMADVLKVDSSDVDAAIQKDGGGVR